MPKGTGRRGAAGAARSRYRDFARRGAHTAHGAATIRDDLTPTQADVLKEYTSAGYILVNDELRTPGGRSPSQMARAAEMTANLDSVFDSPKARFQSNGVVYRGADGPIFDALRAGTLRKGDVYEDKAFVSTSIDALLAAQFSSRVLGEKTLLRIRVKKGQRGLHVESVSGHRDERETLLPRGAKFRVRGVAQTLLPSKYRDVPAQAVNMITVDML